jgi:glutamine cyclotransferase
LPERTRLGLRAGLVLACWLLAWPCAARAEAPVYAAAVAAIHPHDPRASTQGLYFQDGLLVESTGGYRASTLRVVDLASGRVLRSARLSSRHFGEGVAPIAGRIAQLTWESRVGLVYDFKTLDVMATFSYEGEGWGLTADGQRLIMSEGTDRLIFLSTRGFEQIGEVRVRDGQTPVGRLNELEFVAGRVFCNVWQSEHVAVVEPDTGAVAAWIDLSGLRKHLGPQAGVANGIAWDFKGRRLFVTGKLWDRLFEIKVPGGEWLLTGAPRPKPVR